MTHPVSPAIARHRPSRARVLVALAASVLAFFAVLFVLTHWPGGQVPLLTGEGYGGQGGCYLNFFVDTLVVDPTNGTAIIEKYMVGGQPRSRVLPIMWPTGYTARRSGSEVEVLNASGRVMARTGGRYRIQGGYEGAVWRTCAMMPPMENWTPESRL